MTNYSIAEEYTLPSLGKVYKENVNPHIKLRSMTTEEEMKRLAPTERVYKNLCEIIDDCLVEKPGISTYDMCLADYQFLLHKIRIVTYGSSYPVTSKCPYCFSENDHTLQLSEIPVVNYDEDNFDKLTSFTLPKTGKNIKLKIQTPRMIDNVNYEVKELKRKSKGQMSLDPTLLMTVASVIDTIDGIKVDPIKKEDFVRTLPMMDTNYILKHAQKLVESFGLDLKFELDCPTCGLKYNNYFRLTSEFFGPSIDI